MINLQVEKTIGGLIQNSGMLAPKLNQIVQASHFIIENEYKKEVPVNRGFLRKSISTISDMPLSYETGAKIRYAPFVAFGTGIYKNGVDGGYTTGYMRSGKHSKGGIKPNWFHIRAEEKAKRPLVEFLQSQLERLV